MKITKPTIQVMASQPVEEHEGEAIVRDLIWNFTDAASRDLEKIQAHCLRNELPELVKAVQSLKSSCLQMGLVSLGEIIGMLERRASEAQIDVYEIQKLIDEVSEEVELSSKRLIEDAVVMLRQKRWIA